MRSPITCQREREILIMPSTLAAPPLEVKHFPREYKTCITKGIKQYVWKRLLGHLHVSAAEPVPLNVCTAAPRASTLVSVHLTFTPKPPCEIEVCPREWKCTLKYYLRSRTFYSTRKLERVPITLTTKTDPLVRMSEEKSGWEVRGFGPSCWRRGGPPRQAGNPVHDERLRPWTSTLVLPVNTSKNLLPTFFNTLSARQYALVLRLTIEGLYHAEMELIVPIQVIYFPAVAVLPAMPVELEASHQDCDPSSMSGLSIQAMILHDDGDLDSAQEQSLSPPPYDIF